MSTIKNGHTLQNKKFNSRNKIFIGGLAADISENHSRGFGFITLEDNIKIDAILQTQPHIIKGKKVECKKAIPKEIINTQKECLSESSQKRIQRNEETFYSRKLFVGGLPLSLTEEEMTKYFIKYGDVENCLIKRDEETGKSREYGQNHFILGKWVECKRAHPKEFQDPITTNSIPPSSFNQNNNFMNQTGNFALPFPNANQVNNVNIGNNNITQINQTNNTNSIAALPNQWGFPLSSNQRNLFQYQYKLKNPIGDYPNINRDNSRSLNINNIQGDTDGNQMQQSNNIILSQSQTVDTLLPRQNELTVIQENNGPTLDIKKNNAINNNINGNMAGYINNGDIDTFSNYFNNCIKNPYYNSYFYYKLFDTSGEEVSRLAYKNSDKVRLFSDDNQQYDNIDESVLMRQQNTSQSLQSNTNQLLNPNNILNQNRWKHTRNFKLKTDNCNFDNSKVPFKPY